MNAHRPAPAIALHNWGFRHHGRGDPTLSGVDLTIPEGQRVLVLGASGAGKSTLLRAVAGLVDQAGQAEGELIVAGAAPRAGSGVCGYVAQDPTAALVMARVGDDVAFGLENQAVPPAQIWPQVRRALHAVGLDGFDDQNTYRLSGGEQQRVVLAGVAAMRPRVLLLDEPTALLDPDGAAQVRAAVRRLVAETGATLLLVEHRLTDWLDDIDRVVVLDRAQGVVADDTPGRVFATSDSLARLGVWTPGRVLPRLSRPPGSGPAGDVVVRADGLRLRYPDSPVDAVAGVDAVLRAGQALAVTGANGAGKSTVGHLLAGLVAPTGGAVLAASVPASTGSAGRGGQRLHGRASVRRPLHRWRSRDLARTVGMVFQNPEHQFVSNTVAGELAVGQRVAGIDPTAREHRVGDLLDRLGLSALAEADPFTLSGGEQRRLSVATALAAAPAAVVLDEPTYGQDRNTWIELVRLLDEVRADGVALCCISHDADLVACLADDVLTLDHGRPLPTAGSVAS